MPLDAKTKREECYNRTVPVFTRGEHPRLGVGFTYESLQNVADVQLPTTLNETRQTRRTNLSKYVNEIMILEKAGINLSAIAAMCDVPRSTIYRLLDG